HFYEMTMSFFHVGYRVMAVNVSDLAAMGAMPLYYLVSIVIPKRYNEKDILEIYDGMSSFASLYQIDLIGGDTVAGNELVISVTVIGSVSDKHVPYRHNARVDDLVFVTGTLGNAAA